MGGLGTRTLPAREGNRKQQERYVVDPQRDPVQPQDPTAR